MRGVIVLTDAYPYAAGEEFFEQEIEILADRFDEVVVVPMRVWQGAKVTRQMPKNCRSVLLSKPVSTDWRWQALRWFPQIVSSRYRFIEYSPWSDLRRFQMDLRFASNCMDVRRRIIAEFPWDSIREWDDILFYSYWFYTGAAIASILKQERLLDRNVKIISRAHAYDVDERDAPHGYIPSRGFLFENVDVVFPISEYAAGFLLRRFPGQSNKVRIARLGVPESHVNVRSRSEGLRLVSCSHMAPYKRVSLIIETVRELQSRGVETHWTHIGESNVERLDGFKNLAERSLDPGSFRFLGYLSNVDVRRFYAEEELSIFLNVSLSEGVPVSIMEAQSAALPVVATAAGGTGEIVHDHKNGRLLPVEASSADIADAIMEVWERSPEGYRLMSEAAKATWSEMSDSQLQYSRFVMDVEGLFNV